jgi:hypothetical protein
MLRPVALALGVALTAGCHAPKPVDAARQDCVECALRDHNTQAVPYAADEFYRGCTEGDARSCSILGVMYEQGKGGVARDPAFARHLFRYACLHGNPRACVSLGRIVEHNRDDVAGASILFEMACGSGDPRGCYELGRVQHAAGHASAIDALERGCQGKDGSACELLAEIYRDGSGVPRDGTRAQRFALSACALGRVAACR